MYSPAAGQVGLVSDGSRKLLVNNNGEHINNGNFILITLYMQVIIFTMMGIRYFYTFDSDKNKI